MPRRTGLAFGRGLQEQFTGPSSLPPVLQQILVHLSEQAIGTADLFSRDSDTRKVALLRQAWDRGQDPLRMAGVSDCHAVGKVLLHWLEALPQPLLPSQLYPSLIRAASIDNSIEQMAALQRLLSQADTWSVQALFALLAFLHRYTGESGTLPWQLSPTFTPVLIRLSQWQSACQSSHLSADTPQALARKLVTLMIAAAPEIARRDRGPARPAPPSAAAQSGPVEHPRDAPKQPSVGPPTSAAHLDDQKPMLRPLNVYRKAPTNLLHSNGHDFPDKPALSPFLQPAEAAHHSQPINIGHAETSSPGYLAAYRGATHASHSSPPVSPRTPTRQSSLASDGEGDPLLVGLVDELCTLSVHAVLMGEDDSHIQRQASILAGPEGSAADSGASQMQHDAQDELAGASSLQGSSSPRISGLQGNIYACQPQGSQGVQTAMPGLSPLRDSEFEDVPLEPRCHVQAKQKL